MILERQSWVDVDAIAAWNDLADDLVQQNPNNVERVVSGYRIVVVSQDGHFLKGVASSLEGLQP